MTTRYRTSGRPIVAVALAAALVGSAFLAMPMRSASASQMITEYSLPSTRAMPEGLTVGPDGNLWFTDEGTPAAIGKVTTAGIVTEFSPAAEPGFFPFAVAAGPNGNLWFSDDGPNPGIGEIRPSGQMTEYSTGAGSRPEHLVSGPDSSMWFTDPGNHSLGSITTSGTVTTYTVGLDPGSSVAQLVVGADGDVWFTDEGTTPAIGEIDPSGHISEYTTGLVGDPGQIVVGPNGNLWFTEDSPGGVAEITPSGTITSFSTGLATGARPYSIISGPEDDLWFTDQGTVPAVGKITTAGLITEFNRLPAGSIPAVMAFGADGNLWFTDFRSHSIGEVSPSGTITEHSAGLSSASSPYVIEAGPDGNLWFTDPGNGTVGRLVTGPPAPLSAVSPIPTTLVDSVLGTKHRFGARLTYVAQASSPSTKPTGGTVVFATGTRILCKAPLIHGTAKCESTGAPKAGLLTVMAHFGGTPIYRPSSCRSLVRVLPALVGILAGRGAPISGKVRYVAEVVARPPGGGLPGGSVEFLTGGTLICESSLSYGRASCTGKLDPTSCIAAYRPGAVDFAPAETAVSSQPRIGPLLPRS